MAVRPEFLRNIPLFALLDDEESAVLASQVDLKTFAARERIYKAGDPGSAAFVVISGKVSVFTVDKDHQEVVVDEPGNGEFFGFASMLEESPHQTCFAKGRSRTARRALRNATLQLTTTGQCAFRSLPSTLIFLSCCTVAVYVY